tara:strand:+ start:226 stop:465 length:240 start_codon:yes stop_codon:yes gene_type:complete
LYQLKAETAVLVLIETVVQVEALVQEDQVNKPEDQAHQVKAQMAETLRVQVIILELVAVELVQLVKMETMVQVLVVEAV